MRISLLEKREDFYDIACASLSTYWTYYFGRPIQVRMTQEGIAEFDKLYVHKYFNFIAKQKTPKPSFEALEKEYSFSNSFIKSVALKLYFQLSIRQATLPLFAHRTLYVSPAIPEEDSFLIFGGNTRIRIVYPKKKATVVILKEGFDRIYIENEIKLRSINNPSIAPKWMDCHLEKGFFTEEYTPGYPINRLQLETQKEQYKIEGLLGILEEVTLPNCKRVELEDYKIKQLEEIRYYQTLIKNPSCIQMLEEILASLVTHFTTLDGTFWLSLVHGDFQEANILYTEKGVKVIDWETLGHQSITYDFFTINLNARQSGQVRSKEVKHNFFFKKIKRKLLEMLQLDIELEYHKYLALFFMEDLNYRLRTSCSTAFHKNGIGLESKLLHFMKRLKSAFL